MNFIVIVIWKKYWWNRLKEVGALVGKVGHTGLNAGKRGHGEHLHFEINKFDLEMVQLLPCPLEIKTRLALNKSSALDSARGTSFNHSWRKENKASQFYDVQGGVSSVVEILVGFLATLIRTFRPHFSLS